MKFPARWCGIREKCNFSKGNCSNFVFQRIELSYFIPIIVVILKSYFSDTNILYPSITFAGLTSANVLHFGFTERYTGNKFFYLMHLSNTCVSTVQLYACPEGTVSCQSHTDVTTILFTHAGIFEGFNKELRIYRK